MKDPKDKIINVCLREIVGGKTPPDLTKSIMDAWAAECADSRRSGSRRPLTSETLSAPPLSAQEESGEKIIDVCLEEVVGEQSPPDLKDSIIDSWIERQTSGSSTPISSPDRKTSLPDKSAAADEYTRPVWVSWATAACVLVVGSVLGLVAIKLTQNHSQQPNVVENLEQAPGAANERLAQPDGGKKGPNGIENEPWEGLRPPFPQRNSTADNIKGPAPPQPYANVAPRRSQEIVDLINDHVRKKWQQVSVTPVSLATQEEWCRRVHLKLVGRIPSTAELSAFLNDSSPNHRERLVDSLLESDAYADQFVAHWSDFWTTALVGRSKATNRLGSRDGLRSYLRTALAAGKPFNQIAFELVAATGSAKPGPKDFNGAVNFMLVSLDKDAVLATSRTAKVLLGQRMKCVQCHDHHSNGWEQEKFWQLNSFLRQMKVERKGQNVKLSNVDFDKAMVFFGQADGVMGGAYPHYPDGRPAPRTGKVAEFDRRTALAEYIRKAPELGRSVTNRLWSHFFGYGFTKPVDDMGHHNPPSHPELLEHLAGQLTAHEFDLRKMMKWMALSKPFALSSRIPKTGSDSKDNLAEVPSAGTPLFSRYYTRSMKPEEVYKSLVLLSELRKDGFDGNIFFARQQDWVGKNTKKMDTDEGEEKNELKGFRRAIELMNGPLARQATSLAQGGVLHRVINSDMSNDKKIEHLFLAAVVRKPAGREVSFVRKMIENTGGDIKSPLQDLWWALLNSNEFILDH